MVKSKKETHPLMSGKEYKIGDYSIDIDDIFSVGDAELENRGLVHHHITSANDLYEIGIPQIITQVFELNFRLDEIRRNTPEEKNINHLLVNVSFNDVVIHKPTVLNYESGKEEVIFPNVAMLKEKTYKSNLTVTVKINVKAVMENGTTAIKEDMVKNFKICKIPIMVKSKWCNTHNLSRETLTQLREDPSDPGGYFIIRGVEWVIDCVENILFNKVRIFRNEGYKKEIMRAEYISKPGDSYLNSDQFIIRWLNDGQITIEIRREKLKESYIPFYMIFRILGWNSDKQIFDNLLFDYDSHTSHNMIKFLNQAYECDYKHFSKSKGIYSQGETLRYMAEELKDSSFSYLDVEAHPENYQKITNFILEHFDTHFLQHMGTSIASRERKLRFLCILIRKIFLVHLNNMEPTDRDSYNSKRIAAAGTSYAKSFKTSFNASVVQQIKRKLTKDFKTMSFYQIDLASAIKSSVLGAEFERSITQAITAGNKTQITVNQRVRTNRLSSQLLSHKNQLNVFSTLRQVTATSSDSAKQSERANEMRRVHMSFLGYICVTHSPEGEKVGINKQLSIFSFITKASSSEVVKDSLLSDTEIYPLDNIDYKTIADKDLCNVYVNGDWIGCCKNALYIAQKYRKLRREFKFSSPEVTIVWDNTQDEVWFWTDVGRVIRPLLIVYNNYRDAYVFPPAEQNRGAFKQGLALTQDHINKLQSKVINAEDLLRDNVIEYISAEEQENMFLASDFDTLRDNASNELKEYTHCDISQAMLGITALTSPYAAHNQAQRIVYQTSQVKQTCGVFAKNWPFRADKDTFLQYNNETPIVKTISNKYLYPNGSNCIVAFMCNTAYNVEDSLVINKGAIDRGLFNGCKFTFYKTELEQREEFANPDITNTLDIKSASYEKLVNGIIKKGTVVYKNDALIGKILKITKNADDNYQYADRSIIYKESEPGIVHNVIIDRNEEDERFAKVVIRKIRPVTTGDKFSQLPTSQVLTHHGWKEIQDVDINQDMVATLTLDGNLDYVYPSGISSYEYDGEMYSCKSKQLDIFVTKNHKLYVKQHNKKSFELLRTPDVFGKRVIFKKWANNANPDIIHYDAKDINGNIVRYFMDSWLKLLGMFIDNGYCKNNQIIICAEKQNITIDGNRYKAIYNELNKLNVGVHKSLPMYVWYLSQRQSITLLNALIEGDGSYNKQGGYAGYYTSSPELADDITRLALHAGWSGTVKKFSNPEKQAGALHVRIVKTKNEPHINHGHVNKQNVQKEKYVHYKGTVFCLEIPDTHRHVFYSRETNFSPPVITGNSARSGQKGTCGLLLDEADMPMTEDGLKPSIIINPHSIPSRMTAGQLIESLMGNWCAEKCTQTDATIFKKIDIDSISLELENMGLNKHGYQRLYNGITGEFIDSLIFIGPTYYQRLQKFTIDTQYAISNGPSDCVTFQPLDGKSSNGGLKFLDRESCVETNTLLVCIWQATYSLAGKSLCVIKCTLEIL